MAESAPRSEGAEDRDGAIARPESAGNPAVPFLLGPALETTDDTPTIISRAAQPLVRPEEALAAVLRGRKLAHYELIEPIGVGGMAAVIRAHDTQLDRSVALKILPAEMAADPEIVRRFHQEARAAARLDHENIARVFFCGEDQGLHFIAFELVEGENLRALIDRRGRIPVPEAVGYTLQIATGLAHAAARGVVHRDIKPSNIIISSTGRAKLVDMGLARSLDPQHDGSLTQSGVTLGTFDYISPEQALEPREADVRSDIYSLGCTLYHMITGQPPVPDGTAAKKLHHHQHIDPLDPRQLNPDIPDAVVALLSRMMAKNRADRYPQPEQLVQHLVALAQQLGVIAKTPDQVRYLDVPLPPPPRTRPLLVAGLALAGLVALIILLGPAAPRLITQGSATGSPAENRTEPGNSPRQMDSARGNPKAGTGLQSIPAATAIHQEVDRPEQLIALLQKNPSANLEVVLTADIRLSRKHQLVFAGRQLLLTGAARSPTGRPPTISLSYDADPRDEPWAALRVKSGQVTVRGVRFELDGHDALRLVMSAVQRDGGQVTLERCQFDQRRPPSSEFGHMSAVVAQGAPAGPDQPAIRLKECCFIHGQNAVTVTGPIQIEARQCAFGAHTGALFDLAADEKDSLAGSAAVRLQECSAVVVGEAAFRLGPSVQAALETKRCLFSCPEKLDARPFQAILIAESNGAGMPRCKYTGADNRYHNLKALWARTEGLEVLDAIVDLEGLRARLGAEDSASLQLVRSPWASSDAAGLLLAPSSLPPDERQLAESFRLNTGLAQLRRSDDETRMIGVDQGIVSYGQLPSLNLATQKELIVDPKERFPRGNVYATLRLALEYARRGDTILIRHDGLLAVEPVKLERSDIDVTIKAFPNYHPVLTLGQTTELDAAMFRLHDGKLRLEQLEFRLAPARSGFRAQSVVAIMGDGECQFKYCLATLADNRDAALSLVTLADPSEVMRMDPPNPQQNPRLSLEDSFVRGKGNLVTVRASRPFDLQVQDSLVSLDGSFLVEDGNARGPANLTAAVKLRQVTAYLTGHLIWLRALREEGKTLKGLVLTRIDEAVGCLFASATGKALVHLDGIDTEDQMRRYFAWGGSKHNAYSYFNQYLEQQSTMGGEMGMMSPSPYRKERWRDFTFDEDSLFDRIRFNSPPSADEPMSRVVAADFKIRSEMNLQSFGANLDQLPRPAEEVDSAQPSPDSSSDR
jgi:serine/threonine protein kinase